ILSAKHAEQRVNTVLDAINYRLLVDEFVILKPLPYHPLEFSTSRTRMVRDDEDLDTEILTENTSHVVGAGLLLRGIVLSDRPAHGDPSKRCQHINRGFKVVPSDIIEIHVETIVADYPVDLVSDRFVFVVQCVVETVLLFNQFALLRAAGRAKHFRGAKQSRELSDSSTHRTGCPGD